MFRAQIQDEPVAYYAFETLYFTGLRKGELLALNIGDIADSLDKIMEEME